MVPNIAMNPYNSIQYQSFVYTLLNDQTFLFQIIQFSVIHVFALSLNEKKLVFDPQISYYHCKP